MKNQEQQGSSVGKVLTETEIRRRCLQLEILKEWDRGKLTSRECIEQILEIEKIIFYNK